MSENSFIRKIPGGVCAAGGVRAAAVTAGIKASGRPDMMLLVFDPPAQAAGVFTQNLVVAAPVVLCRERVGKAPLRAVLVNSGNANACTGEQGMSNARHLCAALAERLGCSEAEVVMSSTGLIGAQLPVEIMEAALGPLVNGLGADQGAAAAKAIMTTDTRPKECAVEIDLPGGTVRLGGMSKGAGMIAPNLATMLAYLTTDAAVSSTTLQEMLREACEQTFNCITIDGDTSTNDTVLIAATGVSGAAIDSPGACERFAAALREVCLELALAIVRDGEGVTKVVRVKIGGAASVEDARLAARNATPPRLSVERADRVGEPSRQDGDSRRAPQLGAALRRRGPERGQNPAGEDGAPHRGCGRHVGGCPGRWLGGKAGRGDEAARVRDCPQSGGGLGRGRSLDD